MSAVGIGAMYVGEPGPSEHTYHTSSMILPLLSIEIALKGTPNYALPTVTTTTVHISKLHYADFFNVVLGAPQSRPCTAQHCKIPDQ